MTYEEYRQAFIIDKSSNNPYAKIKASTVEEWREKKKVMDSLLSGNTDEFNNELASYFSSLNELQNRIILDYESRKDKYQDPKALASKKEAVEREFEKQKLKANQLVNKYSKYQDVFDAVYGAGAVRDIIQTINNSTSLYDKVIPALEGEVEYWKQFPTEADYNKIIADEEWYENFNYGFKKREYEDYLSSTREELERLHDIYYNMPLKPTEEEQRKADEALEKAQRINYITFQMQSDLEKYEQMKKMDEWHQVDARYKELEDRPDFSRHAYSGEVWEWKKKTIEQSIQARQSFQGGNITQEDVDEIIDLFPYTDEELATMSYLYNTQGEEAVKEYVKHIQDIANYRAGQKIAKKYEGSIFGQIIFGIEAGFEQFVTAAKQLFTEEAIPISPKQYAASIVREEQLKDDDIGRFFFDLAMTSANMAPSLAISSILLKLGMPALGRGLGLSTMGLNAAGAAYNRALLEGRDKNEAKVYAVLVGLSEAGLQYAIGGISRLGGINKLGQKLITYTKNINNTLLRAAVGLVADFAISSIGEYTEEYLQEVLEPFFANVAFYENNEIKLLTPEAFYSGLLGAATAVLFESPRIIKSNITAPIVGKNVIRAKKTNELINNALHLDPNTEAYDIASKLRLGEIKPNPTNIGHLFDAYINAGGNSSFMNVPAEELKKDGIPLNDLLEGTEVVKYKTIEDVFADYDNGTKMAEIIKDESARKIVLDPANAEMLIDKFGIDRAKLVKEKAVLLEKKNKIVDISQINNNIVNRGGIDETGYTEQTQRTADKYGTEAENYTGEPEAIPTASSGTMEETRILGRADSRSVGVSDLTRNILNKRGSLNLNLKSSVDNQAAFSNALAKAVETNYRGPYLTKYSEQDLIKGNVKTFLNDKRNAGVAVWPDGNISSVFKLDNSGLEGVSDDLIITALSNGGNKLDNFDGGLSLIYEDYGFIPVARIAWNQKYAPANWKPEWGKPDIIFWVHNGDSPETVAKNIGTYPAQDTKNIPLFEGDDAYDKAYAYRDSILKQRNVTQETTQQTETLPTQTPPTETPEKEVAPLTVNELKKLYKEKSRLTKQRDKVMAQNLLSDKDKIILDRLLKEEITFADVPETANIKGITELYNASKPLQDVNKTIEAYNRQYKASLMESATEDIQGSDLWVDKKVGLLYQRETMERNFRDIGKKDAEGVKRIIDKYFTPIHKNEADRNNTKNYYRGRIKSLNLSMKANQTIEILEGEQTKKVKVSESWLTHYLGETEDRINYLNEKSRLSDDEVTELNTLQASVKSIRNSLTPEVSNKIDKAIAEMRKCFDELHEQASDVLVKNGYAPVEYRRGYFPHFTENKGDNLLTKIASRLGMRVDNNQLPMDIAGLTHTFRPGKQWSPFLLKREGTRTDYDAVKGFDMYIESISNIIHHTDDIQRLRALENSLRYKYSSEGIKEEIDAIRNSDRAQEDKDARINELYDRGTTHLPNLVIHLRNYTDLLAGKKHIGDRVAESDWGRPIYGWSKEFQNRVASNMVGLNVSTWLTNLIQLTQATGEVSATNLLKAAKDTIASYAKDDGFVGKSTFLTNRRGSDPISTTTIGELQKKLTSPMYYVDLFTSDVVTRGKYYQNMQNGMSEEAAIADADRYGAEIMGDRSKGALPTIFMRRSFIAKALTMFQVEVNNQYSYMFKDLPHNIQAKGKLAFAGALLKIFISSFLFNELFEELTGYRPAPDPIYIAIDAIRCFTNEDISTAESVMKMGKNTLRELPFFGGLLEGGRVPISAALPNVERLIKGDTKELLKPLYYTILPFGGGQLKKAIEGTTAVAQGGGYTADGRLQFASERDIGSYIKAGIFGKYALPNAQEYIEGGFKAFSEGQTEVYKLLIDNGSKAEDAIKVIKTLKDIKPIKDASGNTIKSTTEQIREYLLKADMPANIKEQIDDILINDQKNVSYKDKVSFEISLLPDSIQEKAKTAKSKLGINNGKFLEAYKAQKDIKADKDKKGNSISGSARAKKVYAIQKVLAKGTKNTMWLEANQLYDLLNGNDIKDRYVVTEYDRKIRRVGI